MSVTKSDTDPVSDRDRGSDEGIWRVLQGVIQRYTSDSDRVSDGDS